MDNEVITIPLHDLLKERSKRLPNTEEVVTKSGEKISIVKKMFSRSNATNARIVRFIDEVLMTHPTIQSSQLNKAKEYGALEVEYHKLQKKYELLRKKKASPSK